MMKGTVTILVFLILLLAAVASALFLGVYDVSATSPHSRLAQWVFSFAMEKSVKRNAPDLAPPDLADSSMVRKGFSEFKEMCVMCHGAPGIEPSEIGKGLNPPAPELSKRVRNWSLPELHWIIDHGIKMTGMPGFGKTHGNDAIWSLVAFLKKLDGMKPDEFKEMSEKLGSNVQTHEENHHDSHSF